jgi:FkbM family methyltransferase
MKPCRAVRSHRAWSSTVGAHYGLHTLRFLVHGARVLAFEPNPYCHRWLRAWCAANGVACELEPVAVGERAATVVLAVPEGDTCRASILPGVGAGWRDASVHTVTARQVALDEIVAERGLVPDLAGVRDHRGGRLPTATAHAPTRAPPTSWPRCRPDA